MASTTIQLPAGTDVSHMINFPMAAGWLGGVVVTLCSSVNATVHEMLFIADYGPSVQKRIRRVGGTSANNWFEWTLGKYSRPPWFLYNHESMMWINYTSTANISVCIETNRNVQPRPYPDYPGDVSDWEGTIYYE